MKNIAYTFLIFLKRQQSRVREKINNHICGRQVQHQPSSVFYLSSRVENLQNNPSKIIIGNNTHIRGELLIFKYGGKISIGDYCFVGEGSRIWSGDEIQIGNHVLISHNVNIIDGNSHELDSTERAKTYQQIISEGHPNNRGTINCKPVTIKNNAWISFNSIILKGVTIGEGAIVGAGSVVTDNVPDFAIVAGNPAKIIGKAT